MAVPVKYKEQNYRFRSLEQRFHILSYREVVEVVDGFSFERITNYTERH